MTGEEGRGGRGGEGREREGGRVGGGRRRGRRGGGYLKGCEVFHTEFFEKGGKPSDTPSYQETVPITNVFDT